jgi:hypothetical protein
MINRVVVTALSLLLLPLLLTCGGGASGTGPQPPDPGAVELKLTTPNSDDGIMRIVVTGGAVTAVKSPAYEVQTAIFAADSTVVLVRGDLASGVVAEITVPDRGALASYAVRVDQAASRTTYELQNVANYHVSLVKP